MEHIASLNDTDSGVAGHELSVSWIIVSPAVTMMCQVRYAITARRASWSRALELCPAQNLGLKTS